MKSKLLLVLPLVGLNVCCSVSGETITSKKQVLNGVISDIIRDKKRFQILDPWTFRMEQTFKRIGAPEKNWLDENTWFVPRRNEYKGVEHCVKYSSDNENKMNYLISDSRYPADMKIHVEITISEFASDVPHYKGLKIFKNQGGNETLIYTANHEDKLMNSGTLPDPQDTPQYFEFYDAPRIVVPDTGYSYESYINSPESLKYHSGYDINTRDHAADLYVLLPLGDPLKLHQQYRNLAGPTDFVRMGALGAWNSHWIRYTCDSVQAELDRYRYYNLPLDTVVCDTDWRKNSSHGYEINDELFPNPEEFFSNMKKQNVDICFNDHPEPKDGKNVLDGDEIKYRTEAGLNSILEKGLTYWWYDRNWTTKLISPDNDGLHIETWGAYLYHDASRVHYEKLAKQTGKKYPERAAALSNVDNIENGSWKGIQNSAYHQFPLCWTGDIESQSIHLSSEIKNMINCGYNAIPYNSSDVGGHYPPIASDALYARWIQYGAFSPIFRPHSTQDHEMHSAQPWDRLKTDPQAVERYRNFIRMRYRLMPYLYTLAHENFETGLPICRALTFYYGNAYTAKDEYLFGKNILFKPIIQDTPNDVNLNIYLPDENAQWLDVFHGGIYSGNQTVNLTYTLDEAPLFVRLGSILPLVQDAYNTKEIDWTNIALDIYPGNVNTATSTLYEDDGVTMGYEDNQYRTTDYKYEYNQGNKEVTITLNPTVGSFYGDYTRIYRNYKIRFNMLQNFDSIKNITLDGNNIGYNIIPLSHNDKIPFVFDKPVSFSSVAEFNIPTPVHSGHVIKITLN